MLIGVALQISFIFIALSVDPTGSRLCDFSSANLRPSESLLDQIVQMQKRSSSDEIAFSSCASDSKVCFYDSDAVQTEVTENKELASKIAEEFKSSLEAIEFRGFNPDQVLVAKVKDSSPKSLDTQQTDDPVYIYSIDPNERKVIRLNPETNEISYLDLSSGKLEQYFPSEAGLQFSPDGLYLSPIVKDDFKEDGMSVSLEDLFETHSQVWTPPPSTPTARIMEPTFEMESLAELNAQSKADLLLFFTPETRNLRNEDSQSKSQTKSNGAFDFGFFSSQHGQANFFRTRATPIGFIRTNHFSFRRSSISNASRTNSGFRISASRNYAFKKVGESSYVALALSTHPTEKAVVSGPVNQSLGLGETNGGRISTTADETSSSFGAGSGLMEAELSTPQLSDLDEAINSSAALNPKWEIDSEPDPSSMERQEWDLANLVFASVKNFEPTNGKMRIRNHESESKSPIISETQVATLSTARSNQNSLENSATPFNKSKSKSMPRPYPNYEAVLERFGIRIRDASHRRTA
ncbi:MAG: hypothetical protein COV44_01340 [Deltaproteobacteria bacterium CG11_big_fil_rev_8_21_14_0_20_45_16]|nr:MAG: hypothetical protein COV44_01340 [Deltaproteobacteria bacterium CG11_big_fil_rev_8_21_14_0_20_45_16]